MDGGSDGLASIARALRRAMNALLAAQKTAGAMMTRTDADGLTWQCLTAMDLRDAIARTADSLRRIEQSPAGRLLANSIKEEIVPCSTDG